MKGANARFILVLCALVAGFSLSAQAAYTAANVKGHYSFLLNKWTTTSGDNSGLLGALTFNGVSSVTGTIFDLTSAGLETRTLESDSTYAVTSSGSGSMKLVATEGTITLDFVLTSVSGGVARQLQLLETSPSGDSYVIAGLATAAGLSGSASAANVKGTYSFLLNLWTADATAQRGLIGTATFDGVSKVSVSYTREVDGAATAESDSGTYTIDSDGSGTMTFTKKNGDFVTVGFVLNSVVSSIATSVQVLAGAGSAGVFTGTAVLQ